MGVSRTLVKMAENQDKSQVTLAKHDVQDIVKGKCKHNPAAKIKYLNKHKQLVVYHFSVWNPNFCNSCAAP